ncbi:PTS sugar transporter subunit IIC [Enterococcus faecium]|nr:PTS sugar transporter subunit IIC [Enterococcus faecium]
MAFFPLIVRLPSAVLTFLVVYFGANATESFVNIMPEKLMTGFTVASGLLPAVGFAMLIQGMIDKKSVPYFFIGYLLAAYLGVPVVGVAVAAIMVALLVIQTKRNPVNI